jgi:hypothetical protein
MRRADLCISVRKSIAIFKLLPELRHAHHPVAKSAGARMHYRSWRTIITPITRRRAGSCGVMPFAGGARVTICRQPIDGGVKRRDAALEVARAG